MMERNTESPNDSEHTTVGGRFIAGFAVTGLALALVVSTWSLRAADPENVSDQQDSTVNAQATSTSAEHPTSETTKTSTKPTTKRSEANSTAKDPFLPPHAWEDEYTEVPGQSQQPTAMWLAEPGKAPERRTLNNGPTRQQPAPQPQVQQPSQQPQQTAADTPRTTAPQPLDNWSDITTWLPEFPNQPARTTESEPTTSNPDPVDPEPGGGESGGENPGEPTPIDPEEDNSTEDNPEEIIPDSGNFVDDLVDNLPGTNATGAQ